MPIILLNPPISLDGVDYISGLVITSTLVWLIIQVGITYDDILTTAYMESHGFIRKVQEQRLYPQINVCYGAQYGEGGVTSGKEKESKCTELQSRVFISWML